MITPEKKTIFAAAFSHYLIAGLVTPFVLDLIVRAVILFLFGEEGSASLTSVAISVSLHDSVQAGFLLATVLTSLPLSIAGFYFGTQWSTKSIAKRYRVANRDTVIAVATGMHFLMGSGLLIFFGVRSTQTEMPSAPLALPVVLGMLFVTTALFYLVSKKYLLRVTTQSKIQTTLTSLGVMIVVLGLVGLGYKMLFQLDPLPDALQSATSDAIRMMEVIPLGDVAREDLARVESVLRHHFPNAVVSIERSRELPPIAYNSEEDFYNGIMLWYAISEPKNNLNRFIGVTNSEIDPMSQTEQAFSVTAPHSNAIVLSTFYLNKVNGADDLQNDNLIQNRYEKSLLRALGVTFGFKDSADRSCVMARSHTLEELDARGNDWCGNETIVQKMQGLE